MPAPEAEMALGRTGPGMGLAFPSWRSALCRDLTGQQPKSPLSFIAQPEFSGPSLGEADNMGNGKERYMKVGAGGGG